MVPKYLAVSDHQCACTRRRVNLSAEPLTARAVSRIAATHGRATRLYAHDGLDFLLGGTGRDTFVDHGSYQFYWYFVSEDSVSDFVSGQDTRERRGR